MVGRLVAVGAGQHPAVLELGIARCRHRAVGKYWRSARIGLAFGLLVFERRLAQETAAQWPEASQLAQLSRMAIICLVISAICLLFASAESVWPLRLATLIGLLPALVALEFLLRGVLSLFSPRQPRLEPRLMAQSFIAGLLRWPPQPLLALQHELHNRFGIDLRQIWAFTYMRRAFFPVLLVVLAVGWALTGVHEVPLQGRGIYERFGKPVEVFGPGCMRVCPGRWAAYSTWKTAWCMSWRPASVTPPHRSWLARKARRR